MTRAEAAAAYQVRVQRRQAQQLRNANSGHHSTQVSVSSQIPGSGPPAVIQGITNNQSLLNPLAGTFNPSNSSTALSNWLSLRTQSDPHSRAALHSTGLLAFRLFNARSLNNKLPELHYPLCNEKSDVLCITETWLQPCTSNWLVVGNCHYTLFRTDRLAGCGGVCILTNDNCTKAILVQLPSNFSHLELCTIDIFLADANVKLRLFVCYRPPSGNSDVCVLCNMSKICVTA